MGRAACCLLLLFLVNCASSPNAAGVWTTGAAEHGMTLDLKQDGSATLTTVLDKNNAAGSLTEQGRWTASSGEVKLEFKAQPGRNTPEPLVWTVHGNQLVPQSWNKQEYEESALLFERRN